MLGATGRGDAANRYARLKSIYERIAYDPAQLLAARASMPDRSPDDGPAAVLDLGETPRAVDGNGLDGLSFGKIRRHDHPFLARLAITAATLVTLIIVLLGSLGIAEALTRLVSG